MANDCLVLLLVVNVDSDMHDDIAGLCRLQASDVDFEKGVQLLMESSRVSTNVVDVVGALRIRSTIRLVVVRLL